MPNEFIARNGIIANNNSIITGSLSVSSAITASNITSNTTLNANGTSATFNTANTYINSDNIVVGNNSTDIVGIAANTMYFPGSGSVGIGTTSPGATLEVRRTDTQNQQIVLSNNGTYHTGLIGTSTTTPLTDNNAWGIFGGPNSYVTSIANSAMIVGGSGVPGIGIRFTTSNLNAGSGTTVLYASGSGNVGIGTTSPQSKLSISNTGAEGIEIRPAISSNLNQIFSYNRSSSDRVPLDIDAKTLAIQTEGSTKLFVNNSGNVGIGTTSPSAGYLLDVRGRGKFVSSTGYVLDLIGSGNGQTLIYTDTNETNLISDGSIKLTSSGSVRLFVSASGNVGIGTTSPASKLDVAGITAYNTGLILRGAASDGVGLNLKNTSGHDWYIISTGAGNDGGANNLGFYNHSVGNYLFYLKSDGNVGIGTTSPNAKLDVNGNTIVTGSLTVITGSAIELQVTNTGVRIGNATTDIHPVTGSLRVNGGITGSLLGTASFAVSASWAPGGGASAPTTVTLSRVTGSYTFVLADAGKTIEVSGSTNTTYNLTIPSSSTVNFANGTFMDVTLYGTGSILFTTASVNVTIRSANNWLKMGTRYGASTLIKISGDEWYLIGNLNA